MNLSLEMEEFTELNKIMHFYEYHEKEEAEIGGWLQSIRRMAINER